MELWDIYDENRTKTGRQIVRGQKVPAGYYHIIVHIALFNEKGQMLIQKRQQGKQAWPGLWDISAGGCVKAGESSRLGAARELAEELGITGCEKLMHRILTIEFEGGLDDIYILKMKQDATEFTLQKEEVSEVKWVDEKEIDDLIERGGFVPYHKSHLALIFDMALRADPFSSVDATEE